MGFKTGTATFLDHLGTPHQKPGKTPVKWRPSVYALIPCRNGIVMTMDRDMPGIWMLPGGGLEPDESIADGLRRECREELGTEIVLHTETPRYFGERGFYHKWSREYCHSLIYIFSAEVSTSFIENLPMARPQDNEIDRVELIPLHQLKEVACHPVAWQFLSSLVTR